MTEPSRFSSPPPFKAFPVPFAVIGRSFGITCLLFAIGFCFFKPFFVTGDDPMMTLIAQGAGKDIVQPSEYLLCSNVLLGLCLKILYGISPHLHWYGFFHLAVFFLSMLCFTFLFLEAPLNRVKFVLFLVVFPFEFFYYFAHFEFTYTAFWAAQAGLFLLLDALHKKRGVLFFGISGIFISLAFLIRPQSVFLALLVSLPLAAYEYRRMEKSKKKRAFRFGAPLAVFLLLLHLADSTYLSSHAGWGTVLPYIKVFQELVEYRRFEANPGFQEILRSVGWDGLDFAMYKNWFWQGPTFAIEPLQKMLASAGPAFLNKGLDWQWIFKTDFLVLHLGILALFFPFTPRRNYFVGLGAFVELILVFFFFFYFKKTVSWVVLPLFSYPSFLGLYLAAPEHSPSAALFSRHSTWSKGLGAALLAAWVVFWVPVFRAEWRENRAKVEKEKLIEGDLRALAPRKDRLYVVWATLGGFPLDQLSVFGNYDLFNQVPIYSLTWEQNTPAAKALLARFNIQDLGPGMVDRKDVYFIAKRDFLGLYGQYLREHYRINPAFHWVFHGNTFDAYQVVRDSPGRVEPQRSK